MFLLQNVNALEDYFRHVSFSVDCRLMSSKRQQLFVGLIPKDKWNNEKLCDCFTHYASENGEECIIDFQRMSYNEAKFQSKFLLMPMNIFTSTKL